MKITHDQLSFTDGLHFYRIPLGMVEGLELYFNAGIKQGSFLHAVLCNDFMEACKCADVHNLRNMPAYANFLCNFAPIGSFGSKDNVENWMQRHRKGELIGKV